MLEHPLLFIFDGMSQAYRAFFAIRGLSTSTGLPTNATYGFATMLRRVFDKFGPEYACVVFDSPQPTVRHTQYELYKAQRPKMPSDLSQQIPYIKRYCQAMGLPILETPGFEADDVIGSLALRALDAQLHPVIVTMDKDMLQLVGDILVLNTSKDDLVIDRDVVQELYGVAPEQIPDLLGLWGDSSDNVPGAPGIGEKTAKELVSRFGSIDNLLARTDEVTNAKQRASLVENRDQILLSKQLVTLHTNVPVNPDWETYRRRPPQRADLVPLLRELEFSGMLKELQDAGGTPHVEIETTDTPPQIDALCFLAAFGERLSIWTGEGAVQSVPMATAGPVLESEVTKVVFNLKDTMLRLRKASLEIRPPFEDPMLVAYLLNPNRGRYELADLMLELYGEPTVEDATVPTRRLYEDLFPKMDEWVTQVYREIELPLSPVLAGMEYIGIRVDKTVLARMSSEMGRQIDELTAKIHAIAGTDFNINSPKQLGDVLFEKLNLPHSKKLRKSGQYSTSIEVLEELARDYELPRLILEYRQLAKLKSTYVDALPALTDPQTGRVHTSFNQTGAATGRLSSSNPNLQNIPVRSDAGRKIRGAFVPEAGWSFVSADYSQVELRIVAHLSGDEGMGESFRKGEDIHRRTAAEVLGVPLEAVPPQQRDRAKAVNFGIVYGQTPFGLAQQLGISTDEASDFIDRYFARYAGVRRYLEEVLRQARDTGYVRTLFGRVRQIPEINSRNGMRRSMAERTAINSPIQGTAADIIKMAMLRIDRELRARKLRTRMVLQVHDELIFEVPDDELSVRDLIRDSMQNVVDLRVPLIADIRQGRSWFELK